MAPPNLLTKEKSKPTSGGTSRMEAMRRMLAIAGTLAVGSLGGALAYWIGMPLPWMLGPLFATAALGLAGAPIKPIGRARTLGQVVVGTSIGLQFTQAAVVKLLMLSPLIVGVSVVSTVIGALGAMILMRLTGLDRTTAFFATTSGGVVEMANQAARYGAELEPIAVVHVMRVALIVIIAPLLVIWLEGGVGQNVLAGAPVSYSVFFGLLAVAAIGGLVMAYWDLPNAWFLGPLLVAASIATAGIVAGRTPNVLLVVAQILMGTSLGTQFRREFLNRLLPLILAGIGVVLFTTAMNAGLGVALAFALGLPVSTMILALAPGGMAEMVVTAKLLGLDATLITGFQLLRIILVLVLCNPAYRLFAHLTAKDSGKGEV